MNSILIALVEDNVDLREEMAFHLTHKGHRVEGFPNGEQLDTWLRQATPDVLVLDIGLPGESGLSIAARLRPQHPLMDIVMLTARGEVDDRVAGFGVGADIYLVKPADLRELSVVIESLYRRAHRVAQPVQQSYWQLDCHTLELLAPGGAKILLTPSEFKLMRLLADKAPEGVPRAQLVEALGYRDHDFDHRRLETAMSRLRKKLEMHATEVSPLRSVRTVGYAFVATIRTWTP